MRRFWFFIALLASLLSGSALGAYFYYNHEEMSGMRQRPLQPSPHDTMPASDVRHIEIKGEVYCVYFKTPLECKLSEGDPLRFTVKPRFSKANTVSNGLLIWAIALWEDDPIKAPKAIQSYVRKYPAEVARIKRDIRYQRYREDR